MLPLFLRFPERKVLGPYDPYIIWARVRQNKKCLSVGNFEILMSAIICCQIGTKWVLKLHMFFKNQCVAFLASLTVIDKISYGFILSVIAWNVSAAYTSLYVDAVILWKLCEAAMCYQTQIHSIFVIFFSDIGQCFAPCPNKDSRKSKIRTLGSFGKIYLTFNKYFMPLHKLV